MPAPFQRESGNATATATKRIVSCLLRRSRGPCAAPGKKKVFPFFFLPVGVPES